VERMALFAPPIGGHAGGQNDERRRNRFGRQSRSGRICMRLSGVGRTYQALHHRLRYTESTEIIACDAGYRRRCLGTCRSIKSGNRPGQKGARNLT
jgi:hypothetical protein